MVLPEVSHCLGIGMLAGSPVCLSVKTSWLLGRGLGVEDLRGLEGRGAIPDFPDILQVLLRNCYNDDVDILPNDRKVL
jgi:hypothetical protein